MTEDENNSEGFRIGGIDEEQDVSDSSPLDATESPAQAETVNEEDDDNLTVIVLEQGAENALLSQTAAVGWAEQDSPEMEERRRNILLRELQRVQRASFIHFLILCLIPTSLLFIVIATVVGENETCDSAATKCAKEARTFINAFTTRCVCDAITVTSVNQTPP